MRFDHNGSTLKANDQHVVAAFNSCIDMQKWKALPYNVRQRFRDILKANRVKWVCFSDELGLGLKVYFDTGFSPDGDSDEAIVSAENGAEVEVQTDGHWVRCPAEEWRKLLASVPAEQFAVRNEYGQDYYSEDNLEDTAEDDLIDGGGVYWYPYKARAKKFQNKTDAQIVADRVNGVVVKLR